MIGWVFFRVENISDASNFIFKMFGIGKKGQLDVLYFLDNENLFILCISLLLCLNFFISKESKAYIFIQKQLNDFTLLKQTILICLFLYAIIILNSSSYNPFIYFKF
jgi:alginate O-acetyltransferase complex protein AlgI